jgi:hypothetical protein
MHNNIVRFIEGVKGKIIERIVICTDSDALEVDLQFQDKTSCGIQLEADVRVRVEGAALLGWRHGNSRVIKKLL